MLTAGLGSVFRNGLERTWAVGQQSLLVILLFRVVRHTEQSSRRALETERVLETP